MLTKNEAELLEALEHTTDQKGSHQISGTLDRKLYLQIKYITIYGDRRVKEIIPAALQLYVDKEIAELKEKQKKT